jgi:hypothetical protein
MRSSMIMSFVCGAVVVLATATVAAAQQPPAVRPLGPVTATSAESFGEVLYVRHLKGGVLINDIRSRKLVLLDDKLSNATVIADSTPATATAYSGRSASLLPYKGDSSLFVDAQSMSMLVIDPAGQLTGRVMSIPRSQDAMVLGNPQLGLPGFDPSGRLIYRGMPAFQMRAPARAANPQAGGSAGAPAFAMPDIPDSAAVVRMNLAARTLDTAGFVKTPKVKIDMQNDNGRITIQTIVNPLPMVDDWAVLSDGSVALIRGRDYHVDLVRPDGTKETAAKMPFDWQRLTDDDKRAFLDSVKVARDRLAAAAPQPAVPGVAGGAAPGGAAPGRGGDAGGGRQMITMDFGGGGGGGGGGGPARMGGGGPGGMGANMSFVTADELPDYKPPFFVGNAKADMDGRLWIRTIPTKGIAGGPVYDVINNKGELIERVQVLADRAIIGFGVGGVVYLRVGATSKIERASFK